MSMPLHSKRLLGINSIGRIGKLTLWHHLNLKHFDGIIIMLVGRLVQRLRIFFNT